MLEGAVVRRSTFFSGSESRGPAFYTHAPLLGVARSAGRGRRFAFLPESNICRGAVVEGLYSSFSLQQSLQQNVYLDISRCVLTTGKRPPNTSHVFPIPSCSAAAPLFHSPDLPVPDVLPNGLPSLVPVVPPDDPSTPDSWQPVDRRPQPGRC